MVSGNLQTDKPEAPESISQPVERKIRIEVEYDGTDYHGWQQQSNARSVSGEIEGGIREVIRHPVRLVGSGRTDAGVHALGQVAHFMTTSRLPVENLRKGFNALTPRDIVIREVRDVPHGFHSRRDAVERWYRYQFYLSASPSALYRRIVYPVRDPVDIGAMRQAARHLEGSHDFTSFRSKNCEAKNPVREMYSLELTEEPPFLYLDLRANAFLRSQVRIMASTLLEVGRGKRDPEDMIKILEAKDRDRAGPTLPPTGLILMKVYYPEDKEKPEGESR
jgi:tRNA pseudouridine38-40 synthase